MRLKLPPSLRYPITVTELLARPDAPVKRSDPLFQYTYVTTVTEIDRSGDEHHVEKAFPTRFESSVDGTLRHWHLAPGAVIRGPGADVAEIDEPCPHDVQYGGMCVACGRDMTEVSYASQRADAARAPINMVHDNTALRVSRGEAARAEEAAKRRLLAARKLSLVVDLDQTIIHATVDPTVGEWMADPHSPNHDAVRDVRRFQLMDDGPGGRGTWYYIKLRPGLKDFLERVSSVYELHIYTMGTRAYARHIAALIDPDRRIFGDRILSRDESGSMVAKSLQRLFPVDTKMVVIIDDRGDVWHWNPNLVKVTPFSFFIGIGDINSSFLPKRPKIKLTQPQPPQDGEQTKAEEGKDVDAEAASEAPAMSSGTGTPSEGTDPVTLPAPDADSPSALDQLVSMSQDETTTLQEQTAKQDEAINAQVQERPLLQKQKELDAEDDSSEITAETDNPSPERPRHHLLSDDDHELHYLEQGLRATHAAFFDAFAARLLSSAAPDADDLNLDIVPDIKTVLPTLKSRVLAGVALVFSGVIPLDADPQRAELALWARSFGARVLDRVSRRRTTHVVAARPRTAKVRQAAHRGQGRIHVVGLAWLLDSIVQWRRLDEAPYRLSTDNEADLGRPFPGEEDEDDEVLSESNDDDEAAAGDDEDGAATDSDAERALPAAAAANGAKPLGLSIDTALPRAPSTHGDEDDDDSDADEGDGDGADDGRSDASGRSALPQRPAKRGRGDDDDAGDGAESDGSASGAERRDGPSKRLKKARSPLAGVTVPEAPAAAENGVEVDVRGGKGVADDDDDGWSAFEESFDAAMQEQPTEPEARDGG